MQRGVPAAAPPSYCTLVHFHEPADFTLLTLAGPLHAVYAEGPIDMILQLCAEIDAFLHIAAAPAELPASGDNGTAGGKAVARDAVAEVVAVAGKPESTT